MGMLEQDVSGAKDGQVIHDDAQRDGDAATAGDTANFLFLRG